jgi:hypothetical protein
MPINVDTVVDSLVEEWASSEDINFIGEEIYPLSMYPVIENVYGDHGEVLEFEYFDENWMIVIVNNEVKEIIGGLYVCPIVATVAKAVVCYTFRDSDVTVDTSFLDEIANA